MKKRIFMLLLVMFMRVLADGNEEYTALLVGSSNGDIYIEENIDELHPLASVTKMMTMMVVYDAINKGEINLEDMVDIDREAREINGSKIWIGRGSKLSVEELIKATAIYSANNAAYGLAIYVAGNVDNFVERMNNKVEELGLEGELIFDTPAGLPPHMTGREMDLGTPRGIFELSQEALNYPEYIKIASMKTAIIQGDQKLKNRNNLLSEEKGIYGIKTGYHETAGYNISVVSKREEAEIITVLFGASSGDMRTKVASESIEYFYNNYKNVEIIDETEMLVDVKVAKSEIENLKLYPIEDYGMFMDVNKDVEIEVEIPKIIMAPINEGDVLGYYRVKISGEKVYEKAIYSPLEIKKQNIIKEIFKGIF